MTLSNGDLLAKVTKDDDGTLHLVEGEMQHLFVVLSHASFQRAPPPGQDTGDAAWKHVEKADLEVVD